jgi:hypothetical protein
MIIRARLTAKARRAAFTLAEAMFGVAIMGTVFVSLYTGMATGFRSIRDSQENLRATQIILEKMETIRLYNWDQLNTPGFVPVSFTAKFAPNETQGSQGTIYNGRVTISDPPATEVYRSDLKSVQIDVFWKTAGVTHVRTFTTFVAKYGIQNYIY